MAESNFRPWKEINWHVTVTGNCAISTTGQCQQALNASCYGNTRKSNIGAGKIERLRNTNSGGQGSTGAAPGMGLGRTGSPALAGRAELGGKRVLRGFFVSKVMVLWDQQPALSLQGSLVSGLQPRLKWKLLRRAVGAESVWLQGETHPEPFRKRRVTGGSKHCRELCFA